VDFALLVPSDALALALFPFLAFPTTKSPNPRLFRHLFFCDCADLRLRARLVSLKIVPRFLVRREQLLVKDSSRECVVPIGISGFFAHRLLDLKLRDRFRSLEDYLTFFGMGRTTAPSPRGCPSFLAFWPDSSLHQPYSGEDDDLSGSTFFPEGA